MTISHGGTACSIHIPFCFDAVCNMLAKQCDLVLNIIIR